MRTPHQEEVASEDDPDAGCRRPVRTEPEHRLRCHGSGALLGAAVGADLQDRPGDDRRETDAGCDPSGDLETGEAVGERAARGVPKALHLPVHGAAPLARREGERRVVLVAGSGVDPTDRSENETRARSHRSRDPQRAGHRAVGSGCCRHRGRRTRRARTPRNRRRAHGHDGRPGRHLRSRGGRERVTQEPQGGQRRLDGGTVEPDDVPAPGHSLLVVRDDAVEQREPLVAVALSLEQLARASPTLEPIGQSTERDCPIPRSHGGRQVACEVEAASLPRDPSRLGSVRALRELDLRRLGDGGGGDELPHDEHQKHRKTEESSNVHGLTPFYGLG